MRHDPDSLHRRSIRLRSYDYSESGAYFVTVVTRDRACLFGNVVDEKVVLNDFGSIVADWWRSIPKRYDGVRLDEWIVMPNHVHGIIVVDGAVGAIRVGAIHELPRQGNIVARRRMLLPKITGYFKMNSAKQINADRGTAGQPVWQRNYFMNTSSGTDRLWTASGITSSATSRTGRRTPRILRW